MKPLLDQGLPRNAAELLCQAGLDAVHVGNIGYASATDASILELAQSENRIVITIGVLCPRLYNKKKLTSE
ncbi:MAG: DUF5615 family PIN-like protein [Verrucomicrobia bacterium]|nr:DUF5615 family PIN-like protein [Verrucomicrobiota bacterium]